MNDFFEFTGIKIIPALVSFAAAVLFIIPFTNGIANIGNCAGAVVSIALTAVFVFFRPFTDLIKNLWSKPIGKTIVTAVFSIAGICVIFAVTVSVFMIKAMNDHPENGNTTLIVLGCQVRDGKPSLMLKKRLDAAYEFLSEHEETAVIVSGGKGSDELMSEALCMKNYLVSKGISSERIYMEDKSADTKENLEFSKKLIEREGLCSNITIVTDGYHQLRAEMLASKMGMNAKNISASTSWWLLPTYWVREWFGVAYYVVAA